MNEKTKEFIIKTAVITLCILIVLFFIKIWIINPLSGEKTVKGYEVQNGGGHETSGGFKKKEKIKINWEDADSHLGKYVIVSGKIVASYKNEKVCFLNFHEDFRNYLSLVIFADDFKKFPDNPDKYYLNKNVTVEGRVKHYKGRPEIILNSREQIKIENKD